VSIDDELLSVDDALDLLPADDGLDLAPAGIITGEGLLAGDLLRRLLEIGVATGCGTNTEEGPTDLLFGLPGLADFIGVGGRNKFLGFDAPLFGLPYVGFDTPLFGLPGIPPSAGQSKAFFAC